MLSASLNRGEEMIRQIMYLRFANSFVEPILNKEIVESISVVMTEKFGAEGRGGYFDEYGMIRDVCQNRSSSQLPRGLFALAIAVACLRR
jgi:glucose-6-phosphate 1-dehydrogenase